MALERWNTEREKRQKLSSVRKAAITAREDKRSLANEDEEKKIIYESDEDEDVDISTTIAATPNRYSLRSSTKSTPIKTIPTTPITPVSGHANVSMKKMKKICDMCSGFVCKLCKSSHYEWVNERMWGGEYRFDIICGECGWKMDGVGTSEIIRLPQENDSERKNTEWIKSVPMAQVMGAHYNGQALQSLHQNAAFGAANLMSVTCYNRYKSMNDEQNIEMGKENMEKYCDIISDGAESKNIASAYDFGWGHRRNARYVA